MIVGADGADDATILGTQRRALRRLRPAAGLLLGLQPDPRCERRPAAAKAPPLLREHRLYQADWLMRFYGFAAEEILAGGADGMLDLAIDPKLAWALRHRERFPVDVNRAARELLLRVPGLGKRSVERILAAPPPRTLRLDDLARLARVARRSCGRSWSPPTTGRRGVLDRARPARAASPRAEQLSLLA